MAEFLRFLQRCEIPPVFGAAVHAGRVQEKLDAVQASLGCSHVNCGAAIVIRSIEINSLEVVSESTLTGA